MALPAEIIERRKAMERLREERRRHKPPKPEPKAPIRQTAEELKVKREELQRAGITPELVRKREYLQYSISRKYPEIARNFEPMLRREPEKLDEIIKFLERNAIPVTVGNILVRMKEIGIHW